VSWRTSEGIVELPDGRRLRCRGLHTPLPNDAEPADVGYYLLGRPPPHQEWETRWIRWPDFRLPADPDAALQTLTEAHARSASERVELACAGGIGRTGTALAVLAVLSGVPSERAVDWVRSHHHPRSVETPWQRRWVRRLQR
jgi:protein-tyrosine phosphatase